MKKFLLMFFLITILPSCSSVVVFSSNSVSDVQETLTDTATQKVDGVVGEAKEVSENLDVTYSEHVWEYLGCVVENVNIDNLANVCAENVLADDLASYDPEAEMSLGFGDVICAPLFDFEQFNEDNAASSNFTDFLNKKIVLNDDFKKCITVVN